MAMMRVVHLVNALNLGGAERFVVDLVKHLPRDEFDVRILCLTQKGDLAVEVESIGIPVSVLHVPHKFGFEGYKKVYRALSDGGFDILHCHLLSSCWYGLPAGWLARVPVRIAHLQNCHWRMGLKSRLWDRLAFQFGNVAFGCSQAVLRFYQERMWYPPSKLHLVYNAVDVHRFEQLPEKTAVRRELELAEHDIIVTTVASLTPQKGHEYLLQAVKEIVMRHRNIKFVFVGAGGLRTALETRVRTLGIEPWVRFLGKRTDVPEILGASDMFVLPSLWEGFGLVLVEAGLARLPVVASRIDGIGEIVWAGRNGLLVPPKDVSALVEACLKLIEDPQLREQMGEEGKAIALERFDIRQIASRVTDLYRILLSKKSR